MHTNYGIYSKLTGIFRCGISCPSSMVEMHLQVDEAYIEIAFTQCTAIQYIPDTNNPIPTDKMTQTINFDKTILIANGTEELTITNIAVGTHLKVTATTGTDFELDITDSTLILTFSEISKYDFLFTKYDYLDFIGTVNAI